jgi:hypothetical protein
LSRIFEKILKVFFVIVIDVKASQSQAFGLAFSLSYASERGCKGSKNFLRKSRGF